MGILIFDFNNEVPGTPKLNSNYVYDTLSIFFNFGSEGSGETYYWDDITFLDEYVAPVTLSREMLIGDWKLAPEYGSMGVGPNQEIPPFGSLIVMQWRKDHVCLMIFSPSQMMAIFKILWVVKLGLRLGREQVKTLWDASCAT